MNLLSVTDFLQNYYGLQVPYDRCSLAVNTLGQSRGRSVCWLYYPLHSFCLFVHPSDSCVQLELDTDDTELSMKTHVCKVASSCFYQLRCLWQIRCLVGQEVAAQLVSAFILSRLDYCNSVLAGLPQCTTEPLQRVLNACSSSTHSQPTTA